jgi:hypothetical protein
VSAARWATSGASSGITPATPPSRRSPSLRADPDLSGPLAQLHIAPDGIVTIVAVGPCNHAGKGSWEGLPTDGANQHTIGIECAWPRDTSLTEATMAREPWPEAQMRSMIDVGYALAKKIGNGADHNITHAQWARFGPAGYRQYKWDPGNFDIWWFRGEIAKRLAADATPPIPTAPPVPPPPAVVPDKAGGSADDQLTYRWNQLGGQTVVEALAQVRDKVCGTQDAGKPGVKTLHEDRRDVRRPRRGRRFPRDRQGQGAAEAQVHPGAQHARRRRPVHPRTDRRGSARAGHLHRRGKPGAPRYIPGVVNVEFKYDVGLLKRPDPVKPIIFTVEGHMSNMFFGPCAQTAGELEQEGFVHWKPVGDWDTSTAVQERHRRRSAVPAAQLGVHRRPADRPEQP